MNAERCKTLTQTNHKVWLVSQIPKYTFSHISRQKQANSGIGWSDEGIAKYNTIYDLVESDCQLQGTTFNQELLKVHQRRHQKNKKTTEWNVVNERAKKRKPRDNLQESQNFERGPPWSSQGGFCLYSAILFYNIACLQI